MHYYLGLDNGGTSTKAAVFDRTGRELGVSSMETKMLTPAPGFAERDMEEMWQANCHVIREVQKKTGISPEMIAGVGICGHGKGIYLWGKDGKPARRGIISTDNRAYTYQKRWEQDGTTVKAFEKNCQQTLSCQPTALLAWLKDHEPETLEKTEWIFGCKDYVRFRMTEEAGAELTDISGSGLLNLHTKKYDKELLALYDLSEVWDKLPMLVGSTDICGYVSEKAAQECGLLPGTPVIGGMFDIDACALAAGVVDEPKLCMIAGTWSINGYIRRKPVLDQSLRMNSLFCIPHYYLIEESSPTSAGNHAWFLRQLLPELEQEAREVEESVYDWMNEWVEQITPYRFIPVFLPFLLGSNVHPDAKGCFLGLTAAHTRKELCRSIYEGVVFSHRYHLEKLLKSCPEKEFKCIRLAGGAARSKVWAQMFADVCGFPVETVSANETGALGCAMAVAAALGDYKDLAAAAEAMCSISSRYLPDLSVMEIYEKKYQVYIRAIELLNGFWPVLQNLIE